MKTADEGFVIVERVTVGRGLYSKPSVYSPGNVGAKATAGHAG